MNLAKATAAAATIAADLRPFCRDISLYGSVAAGDESPGDIDLRVDPVSVEALRHHLRRRALIVWENKTPPIWRINWPEIGQVDLFIHREDFPRAGQPVQTSGR